MTTSSHESPSLGGPPSSRVFRGRKLWRLEEAAFTAATSLLTEALGEEEIDIVVGVRRGGVPLATALAARLARPATTLRACHNVSDALRLPATGTVTLDLTDTHLPPDGHVLLCDDIAGSGATLAAATDALRNRVRRILTVTLCRNIGTLRDPDMWIWDVDDWVTFPWEPPPDAATDPLPPSSRAHRGGR
jgi:hypoxanthine phosphoribosyltransferase